MIGEEDESRRIIEVVQDGKKSEHWKLLERAILEWIEEENKRLDSYKRSGISKDREIDKYNRAVDRIVYLKRFLVINETMISYHTSFLMRVKTELIGVTRWAESFFEEVVKK